MTDELDLDMPTEQELPKKKAKDIFSELEKVKEKIVKMNKTDDYNIALAAKQIDGAIMLLKKSQK